MFLTILWLAVLFGVSGVVWFTLIGKWLRQKPFLEINDQPRANWKSASEMAGVYIALCWVVVPFVPQTSVSSATRPLQIDPIVLVANQAAINFGACFFLPCLLVMRCRSWSAFGMSTVNLGHQIRVGVRFFFAAVIPMTISILVTLPIRPLESQHALLKLLVDSPDWTTVAVIVVTAVLSAPLLEELIFRVILQGWLTTVFSPRAGISVVVVIFALVHGWRNGLALLPLALILGYVFYRCHSYLAVVMIHAQFNATMLILQVLNPQSP